MNFVVLGGSKGLGKSVTDQLVSKGHKVCVGSRDVSKVKGANVVGIKTNAAFWSDVKKLSEAAVAEHGHIDAWINCQGLSGGFGDFKTMNPEMLGAVAMTNLLGTMNGSRCALETFDSQGRRGHLFNVTGAGYDFKATPGHAAYGATKAGVTQLTKSLRVENPNHGVHLVNPGMMKTELLYEGLPDEIFERVNMLAESTDVVAAVMVIKILLAMNRGSRGATFNYMTPKRVLRKLYMGVGDTPP